MDDGTALAIRKWKTHRYRATDVPLGEGVDSLVSSNPLIEARQSEIRKNDWVICHVGTTTAALFVFAGVFADADPYETGNLVPPKTALPAGLEESRCARHAGYKAAYSYAIDTYHDKDIWEFQAALDAYMTNVPGFNSRQVKRRDWQNGSTWHVRYWFRVPMFLTCETRGGRPDAPEGLHEWVASAHKKTKNYRANPVRPLVCGLEDGRLRNIADCTPNVLEYGDVVSLVFSLVYVEDREDWGPVPMVTHVIRVQRANRITYPLTSDLVIAEPVADVGGLCVGVVVDADQAAAADAAREAAAAAAVTEKSAVQVVLTAPANASCSASVVAGALTLAGTEQGQVGGSNELRLPGSSTVGLEATAERQKASDTGGRHAAGDNSESEMDVDDDMTTPGKTGGNEVAGEDDGDGSSVGSTITETSASASGVDRDPNGGLKRRGRSRSGSGDEGPVRRKFARPSAAGGGRRGGKVKR